MLKRFFLEECPIVDDRDLVYKEAKSANEGKPDECAPLIKK